MNVTRIPSVLMLGSMALLVYVGAGLSGLLAFLVIVAGIELLPAPSRVRLAAWIHQRPWRRRQEGDDA